MDALRKSGDSVGARITVVADGVPPGWGEPIYGKLDGELAAALMSINAVKGVEIGDGFAAVMPRCPPPNRWKPHRTRVNNWNSPRRTWTWATTMQRARCCATCSTAAIQPRATGRRGCCATCDATGVSRASRGSG